MGGVQSAGNAYVSEFEISSFVVKVTNEIKIDALVTIFPNPTTGRFSLNFDDVLPKESFIAIYDVFGHTMLKNAIGTVSRSDDTYWFDLSDKPNGIYFVNVICGNRIYRGKLIKI
jgi:Secretion system C-terminal sorting domain